MKRFKKNLFLAAGCLLVLTGIVSMMSCSRKKDAAPSAMQPVTWRLATVGNPGDGLTAGCEYFAREVEKRTNGLIKIEVFLSSQLGGYGDYISGLQMGSIQVAEIGTAVLTNISPKFAVFDLPYLSPSVEGQKKLLREGVADILNAELSAKADFIVAGWIVRPARSVYSSKGPINSLADFKGLKIRLMPSAPMIRAFELLGSTPSPIPTAERYMALQTKVVDAAENNMVEILNAKEYEVTKYLSLTEHIIQPACICVSNKVLNSLPPDIRKIVLEVGLESGDAGGNRDQEIVATARERLAKEGGMIINDIADKSQFLKAVQPLYEEQREAIGADLLALFGVK